MKEAHYHYATLPNIALQYKYLCMETLQVYPSFKTAWGEHVHVSQNFDDSFIAVVQRLNLSAEINYFSSEPELLEYLELLDQNRRY